jgi:hypothetical protein
MYQSYEVNNPVTRLLKVHWHGWYVHIIFHESPKWKARGCRTGWFWWPRNAAATTYPSFRERLVQVMQGTGWYLSHDSVEGATYETVFPAVQISPAAGVRAQWSTTSEKLLYRYAELPPRGQFVFGLNCFKWRGYLSLVREGESS